MIIVFYGFVAGMILGTTSIIFKSECSKSECSKSECSKPEYSKSTYVDCTKNKSYIFCNPPPF